MQMLVKGKYFKSNYFSWVPIFFVFLPTVPPPPGLTGRISCPDDVIVAEMVVLQESLFGWRVNIVMIGCLYKKPKIMIRNSIQELKRVICDQGHGIKETTISSTHVDPQLLKLLLCSHTRTPRCWPVSSRTYYAFICCH